MSTRVTCRCGQAFAAASELAGTTVPCPVCGAPIAIPSPAAARPAESPVLQPSAIGGGSASPWILWLAVAAGGAVCLLVLVIAVSAVLPDGGEQAAVPVPPATVSPNVPTARIPQPQSSGNAPPPPPPAAGSDESHEPAPETVKAPRSRGKLQTRFVIGPEMYELTLPPAEPIEGDERLSSAGITITGGATLPSDVTADEIRARIDEFRAGRTGELGNLTVSWALIIKPEPKEPSPNKNPSAEPININGLAGLKVRGPGSQVTWAFGTVDHTLLISVRGPAERVNSPEIQAIVQSLRRTGGVPAELAQQAQGAAAQTP